MAADPEGVAAVTNLARLAGVLRGLKATFGAEKGNLMEEQA